MSWILVAWVICNFVLFSILLGYAIRLQQKWKSTSIGFIATTLVLVAGVILMAGLQRIGIQGARSTLMPAEWEDFFLTQYQVVLSVVGTIAGLYAITRLRSGIKRLEEGERMLNVLTGNVPLDVDASKWGLTERETEVLDTIVSGQTSDEQIAEALFISTATAATHVRNILRKTGLSSRIDLMLVGGRIETPRRSAGGPDVPDTR